MDSHHAQLMRWNIDGPLAAERSAQMIADPRFSDAVRALASNMIAAAASDKKLDGIFKDGGRYVAAMLAVHLHTSGGLTLPRLKEMCKAFGYLSPGRARAMLIYLQYLGYVELTRSGTPARYAPTVRFVTSWRSHLCAALEAVRVVEPSVDLVLGRMHEPGTLETFARMHTDFLLGLAREGRNDAPFIRVFTHRYAGSQIVWTLLLADDSDFPPSRPVTFSAGAAARRFGVSRMHIKRVLDEAEREGLLAICDGGTIVLQDSTRSYIREFYAMQLIGLLVAAAKTVRERPELVSEPGPPQMAAKQAGEAATL
jgi:hypothetical protein